MEYSERRTDDFLFIGSLSGRRCEKCGETFMPALAIEAFENEIARQLAQRGAHSPSAFKFMRKVAGLKSVELATLLGVQPETISRWESGQNPLDPKAVALIGNLVLDRLEGHSATRKRLEAIQKPRRTERPTRIAVAV